jgi:hypothetical protein
VPGSLDEVLLGQWPVDERVQSGELSIVRTTSRPRR